MSLNIVSSLFPYLFSLSLTTLFCRFSNMPWHLMFYSFPQCVSSAWSSAVMGIPHFPAPSWPLEGYTPFLRVWPCDCAYTPELPLFKQASFFLTTTSELSLHAQWSVWRLSQHKLQNSILLGQGCSVTSACWGHLESRFCHPCHGIFSLVSYPL